MRSKTPIFLMAIAAIVLLTSGCESYADLGSPQSMYDAGRDPSKLGNHQAPQVAAAAGAGVRGDHSPTVLKPAST